MPVLSRKEYAMSEGASGGEGLLSPGDLVVLLEPMWLSGSVAREAEDPPDLPAGSTMRVREQDADAELEAGMIELVLPNQDESAFVVASLIVPRTAVQIVTPTEGSETHEKEK
jgi:hypothetical protein